MITHLSKQTHSINLLHRSAKQKGHTTYHSKCDDQYFDLRENIYIPEEGHLLIPTE